MQAARGASLISDRAPSRSAVPLLAAVALIAWLADQGTKVLAVRHLAGHDPVEVLGPLLKLTLTRNPGAAFSTGTGVTGLIAVFAILATVVVCWYALRVRTTLWAVAIGLVLAGITGNLTDRIFRGPAPLRGHVVDFLQLPHWPIFNVADICINIGVLLVVIQLFRGVHLDGSRDEDPAGAEEGPP